MTHSPQAQVGGDPSDGPKELLRSAVCGSVDDGKSTLIGRLLVDAGALPDDELDALAAFAPATQRTASGAAPPDLSHLLDGLAAEREQGITIDVTFLHFVTALRRYVVGAASIQQFAEREAPALRGRPGPAPAAFHTVPARCPAKPGLHAGRPVSEAPVCAAD